MYMEHNTHVHSQQIFSTCVSLFRIDPTPYRVSHSQIQKWHMY